MSEQGQPKPRVRQSVGDIVRSLAVVLVVVAFILLVTRRPQPDPVRVVDPAPALAQARSQATFPVEFPEPVPDGWRVTSARWEPTPGSAPDDAWQAGFVTSANAYVQLGQSATSDPDYVEEQVGRARPAGPVVIAGTQWQAYDSSDQAALVRVSGGATTVVSGTAGLPVLEAFAASLR